MMTAVQWRKSAAARRRENERRRASKSFPACVSTQAHLARLTKSCSRLRTESRRIAPASAGRGGAQNGSTGSPRHRAVTPGKRRRVMAPTAITRISGRMPDQSRGAQSHGLARCNALEVQGSVAAVFAQSLAALLAAAPYGSAIAKEDDAIAWTRTFMRIFRRCSTQSYPSNLGSQCLANSPQVSYRT